MQRTYTHPRYAFQRPPELDGAGPPQRPVVVVGAGPVGLCAAIDLAQRGVPVVLLDEDDTVSIGSRGLCYAQRTLQILDRLGCGQPVVDKGVTWNVGRTFFGTEEVFHFNLQPEPGHERPGMVNLQQYHLEEALIARARQLPKLELRFRQRCTQVTPRDDGVTLQVTTPEGGYTLNAQWLVVCDGARSTIRRQLGLDVEGQVFQDRFLIADVVMQAEFPAERWFWFDPPFHPGQSVLLHREADNVWRIDFQLGWQADPEDEKKPERVLPRIQALLQQAGLRGPDGQPLPPPAFDLEWVSVYTFQCRRMARFRQGRVLFAGDSAHQVSPFGARGANSGIQDSDNLAWKLKAVLDGRAGEALLDRYSDERVQAADENLLNSTRSTDFITPKSAVSRTFRDAVLGLAGRHAFARSLVNSGRLSVPTTLSDSALNTPDRSPFAGWMQPGAPLDDAPITVAEQPGWLLRALACGPAAEDCGFSLLVAGDVDRALLPAADALPAPLRVHRVVPAGDGATAGTEGGCLESPPWVDGEGWVTRRLDLQPGTAYLLRPDQHVAARWRAGEWDGAGLVAAMRRALGWTPGTAEHRAPVAPSAFGTAAAGTADAGETAVRGPGSKPTAASAEALSEAAEPSRSATSSATLNTQPHFHAAATAHRAPYTASDAFYQALIDAHRGLDDAASHDLNARLVLLLANHIGALPVLQQALDAAREGAGKPSA